MHISILSSSVRTGRYSHRVALFFQKYIQDNYDVAADIIDLKEYDFPVFHERLRYLKDPDAKTKNFAERIKNADGIIIVTPEYNGGYPSSLKNVIDLLYDEWKRKPLALVSVSDGPFAASQVLTSLLFTLWKIGAWMVPARFQVANVPASYDEHGVPSDKAGSEKRAKVFIEELLWCMQRV